MVCEGISIASVRRIPASECTLSRGSSGVVDGNKSDGDGCGKGNGDGDGCGEGNGDGEGCGEGNGDGVSDGKDEESRESFCGPLSK